MPPTIPSDRSDPHADPLALPADRLGAGAIARWRLGAGLLQGLALYLLYRAADQAAWPATVPLLYGPLVLVAVLAPVLLISSLGQLTRRQLLAWCATAAAIVALLAVYDIWRELDAPVAHGQWRPAMPSPQLNLFLAAGFFIAQALVLSGAQERRRIASYPTYFELAWKLGVQLAFCALFVGATWLVLHLGAQLFLLVKLDFLRKTIGKPWFAIPVTAFAFACAMHLTDMRPAIVRGIRKLLLALLSWILPVLALLVAGFLASLPFTGLAPLWATKSAAAVLLGTAAAFVILVNAAWQNGAAAAARPVALAARAAGLLLVPVVLLAVYALALRVQDHGWTEDRVFAAACMLVAACYAGGYAAAGLRRGWLPSLAGVNVATAFVVLGVLLLLSSPLADPARLSVNDQLARLGRGEVAAADFDAVYLRFRGGRYGRAALDRLEARARAGGQEALRARIAAVRAMRGPHDLLTEPIRLADNLRAWPAGTQLPASFLAMDWTTFKDMPAVPECLRRRGVVCDAFLLDLSGDGEPELILAASTYGNAAVLREAAPGAWRVEGVLTQPLGLCHALLRGLQEGKARALPPVLADIEVGGQRLRVAPPYEPGPACGVQAAQPDAARH